MSPEISFLFIIATLLLLVLYYFKHKEVKEVRLREKNLGDYTQALNSTINTLKTQNEQLLENSVALQRSNSLLLVSSKDLQAKIDKAYSVIPNLVNQQVDDFKRVEIENLRATLNLAAKQTAKAELQEWKTQYEAYFRQDAINRSQAVIMGKVTEHLIPFHNSFPFNPKEARFIGSPIDMIVFHGIENEDIVEVFILEIKTSSSSLSKRQKLIKAAVQEGRVYWTELRM